MACKYTASDALQALNKVYAALLQDAAGVAAAAAGGGGRGQGTGGENWRVDYWGL